MSDLGRYDAEKVTKLVLDLQAERDRLKAQLDIAVESLRDIAEYEFTAGYKAQQALARIKELGDV